MKPVPNDFKSVFADGILPRIMQANRQEYNSKKHDRPMHSHNSLCELLLCYRGTGIYNVNNDTYEVHEGDLLFYNVGELHEVVSTTSSEIGTYCFGFSNVQFLGMRKNQLIPDDSSHVRSSGSDYPLLASLCDRLLDLDSSDPMQAALIQSMGIAILLTAVRLPAEPRQQSALTASSELTFLVKDYINANYTENIKLEDIANALSFSASYISHTFKTTTGYSPVQYLIRCRIGLSQTLLISSEMSVTQIAAQVGYANSNHFQTLFKQVVGISPLQYRKKYLKNLHGDRNQT
ncbi:MAG: AraC family transcriptional regulator [Lachnospiraceae bacterium]|nr:AraC family transcriptional regulator [Lachnospiraceae bacterium]